jgi:hypothetical protein
LRPLRPSGPAGATGPAGPQGVAGPQGPAGPPGGGLLLIDSNNVTLGKAAAVNDYGVTFITSTGHMVFVEWTGTIPTGQVWYTNSACTANPHLNSGGSDPDPLFGKTVVRLHTGNKLMVPSNVGPNGVSLAQPVNVVAIDNPTCGSHPATPRWGWPLMEVTRAQVGLPASITAPLRLQ